MFWIVWSVFMNCMSTLYEKVVECGVLSPGLFYIHKKKEKNLHVCQQDMK